MVDPCIDSLTRAALRAQSLSDKLFGTKHVDKLLTADRGYALLVIIMVLMLARFAFQIPFVFRRYTAGVSATHFATDAPVDAASIESELVSETPEPTFSLSTLHTFKAEDGNCAL